MYRAVLFVLLVPAAARAGLYYSGETIAELPSAWRGFLLDQRSLRQAAAADAGGPLRKRYAQEAARLAKSPRLSADEAADLGALYVRLGEPNRALAVLRPAQRAHPVHFRLAANLGTAWQLKGDLAQAAAALDQAVRLAPGKHLAAERLHLKLVRQRLRERPPTHSLDDLFGVRFTGPPGRLAAAEQKKLPTAAAADVQQLALWLPADARLLWLLAELAAAHGDVGVAAAMLDGCVTEFGLRHPDLLARRRLMRAAADDEKKHAAHARPLQARSSRPLVNPLGLVALPPINPKGVTPLAWEAVTATTLDRQSRPTFGRYLRELDGRSVDLRGYMQPLGEDTDLGAFLLVQHPIGCWFCEMPALTGIVLVELPEGQSGRMTRSRLRVTGTLRLNAADPENFLFIVRGAKVSEAASE